MFPNQGDIFSLFLVHDACVRSYFKNMSLVFHWGFQTQENWWKHSADGLMLSSVFLCLETPMKHSHLFLKYYV